MAKCEGPETGLPSRVFEEEQRGQCGWNTGSKGAE